MRLSYYSSLTLQMTGPIHLQANGIDLEKRQQHHAFGYGNPKRVLPRFGEFCSCCSLPLLPQLTNSILAT